MLDRRGFLVLASAAMVALLAYGGAAAAAEQKPSIHVTKLTGHLYKLSYDVGYVVNMVASVGDDGVLLVDTGEKAQADSLREAIRGFGCGAPRYIVNTHAHVDHTGGNAAWGNAPVVIAHQVLRTRLRSGSYLFDEFPDAALPDTTFTDSMTLRFNGEEIRILAFPGAHDDNDAIVWFTGSSVVAAGDLIYANGFPSVEEVTGNVLGYRDVVPRILESVPRDVTFVCGHSEEADVATAERFDRAIRETAAIVEREVCEGRTAAEMEQAHVLRNWEGYARGYVSIDEWIEMLVDAYKPPAAARTLYEPMYRSLRDGGIGSAIATYDRLKRTHRDEYRFVENDLAFMADKLTRAGRANEAIAFWGLYLREYPQGALRWYAYYDMGRLRAGAGEREAAAADFQKALELSPGNPRVLGSLRDLEGKGRP